jgi:hypothetical protein
MGSAVSDQLALFCSHCAGSGVTVVTAPNHDGDPVEVPIPCPVCRPTPALRETWLAVASLGRRLEPEPPAAGR